MYLGYFSLHFEVVVDALVFYFNAEECAFVFVLCLCCSHVFAWLGPMCCTRRVMQM